MPITEVVSNAQDLTLTIVGDYPVSLERLWDAYVDPRQLERFWGPEQWPATFTRHDMAVGGESHYYMTGPDGTKAHGWFRYTAVEPHTRIALVDGFGEEPSKASPEMPTMEMVFTFHRTDSGSRFKSVTTFPSVEAMEQLVNMGMVEGIKSAMGQADAVLTDLKSFAASRATEAQMLSDTQVRISRVIRGSATQVWRAHQEPSLLQQWLTGPDGWTMPVCRIASKVGDMYRYEWAQTDGTQRFGFEGKLLEMAAPYRAVTTEQMIDTDGPSTHNELTLTSVEGGTLLSMVITYPTKELRDMILGTGMTNGMESSYARLEQVMASA
jgi:uncharacterized protein YndB with AHSA1/START domain